MTKIAVIAGSVRPGRTGSAVAQWVAGKADAVEGVRAEVVEIADFNLPVFVYQTTPHI